MQTAGKGDATDGAEIPAAPGGRRETVVQPLGGDENVAKPSRSEASDVARRM